MWYYELKTLVYFCFTRSLCRTTLHYHNTDCYCEIKYHGSCFSFFFWFFSFLSFFLSPEATSSISIVCEVGRTSSGKRSVPCQYFTTMLQETFKNFSINVIALNDRSTFSSGDPVTGHVSFDLMKETKITSISMHVKGEVNIQWHGKPITMGPGRRKHHHFRQQFFGLEQVLMQGDSSMYSLNVFGRNINCHHQHTSP